MVVKSTKIITITGKLEQCIKYYQTKCDQFRPSSQQCNVGKFFKKTQLSRGVCLSVKAETCTAVEIQVKYVHNINFSNRHDLCDNCTLCRSFTSMLWP